MIIQEGVINKVTASCIVYTRTRSGATTNIRRIFATGTSTIGDNIDQIYENLRLNAEYKYRAKFPKLDYNETIYVTIEDVEDVKRVLPEGARESTFVSRGKQRYVLRNEKGRFITTKRANTQRFDLQGLAELFSDQSPY